MLVISGASKSNGADGWSDVQCSKSPKRSTDMFEQLTSSVRRFAAAGSSSGSDRSSVPLVGLGDGSDHPVAVAQTDIAMLRGVSDAAADVAECTCPEPCERDHANE